MKKIFITLIVIICLLCGCSKTDDRVYKTIKESRIVSIEDVTYRGNVYYGICYDKYTGVMYYRNRYCFEPLYNSDGSLLIWDGGENK